MSIHEIRDNAKKNNIKVKAELSMIKGMLKDKNSAAVAQAIRKEEAKKIPKLPNKKENAVSKLSSALKNYKNDRINMENELVRRISKVNYDKNILFREK